MLQPRIRNKVRPVLDARWLSVSSRIHQRYSTAWTPKFLLLASSQTRRTGSLNLAKDASFLRQRNAETRCTRAAGTLVPSDTQRQTIYALATPPGRGGIAVIRISGPEVLAVYRRIVRLTGTRIKPSNVYAPPIQLIQRCVILDPANGEELDDGLAVYFKGPHSFTTEDVLELHIHSGRAIINSVLTALSKLARPDSGSLNLPPVLLRQAEPGEFTKRAYQGGRIDLTQAEALNDLINAQTDGQRRLAHLAAKGKTRVALETYRTAILRAMALVEAVIDFGEDQNLEGNDDIIKKAQTLVCELTKEIQHHLQDSWRGEVIRSGIQLVIYGPPNVGKSTLFNNLVGRDAAIVTHIPGTTRDVLELTIDIGGVAVIVSDTAGLHETEDLAEQIGIQRARQKVNNAHLLLCVLALPDVISKDGVVLMPKVVEDLHVPGRTVYLLNKSDLVDGHAVREAKESIERHFSLSKGAVWTASASCGHEMDSFLSGLSVALHERILTTENAVDSDPLISNARHREHLESAVRFMQAFQSTDDIVIRAEELRYAAQAIGKITGAIDGEEILDVIFREFCIGK